MKKNKILPIITMISSTIFSQGIANNKVFGEDKKTDNKVTQQVDNLKEDPKEMEKKAEEKKRYEKTSKNLMATTKNTLFNALHGIHVNIKDNGSYEFKYKKHWFWSRIDFGPELSGGPDLTISSEAEIDKVANKIVNAALKWAIDFQSEGFGGKIIRFIDRTDKFSDVVELWKKDNSYDSRIQELKNEIIDQLIDKMRQAKDKNKK